MRLLSVLTCAVLLGCQTTAPTPDPMPAPDKCKFAEVISSALTNPIANLLGCQNPAAIKRDIIAQIYAKTHVCGETQQNVVTDLICDQVAGIMLTTVMHQTPATWMCDGGDIGKMGRDKLAAACRAKLGGE